jgi:hypothetical protein
MQKPFGALQAPLARFPVPMWRDFPQRDFGKTFEDSLQHGSTVQWIDESLAEPHRVGIDNLRFAHHLSAGKPIQ